ncbi:MAG: acyl-CoA carboxylase subunit beta [Deltaproteobacteria bacterium]|nr:MAG: acyl-CoA carboxylase subunit beta [Deltaproteobacteria bacterium]
MQVLDSKIDTASESFLANKVYMEAYVDKVRQVERKQLETELGYRPRAHQRGKLLPRERLALLLDPGTPFVELCSIAGYGMYDDSDGRFSGGNLITGIGTIARRRCLVIVWNYAIKGGTIDSVNVKKMLRIQQIAFRTRLPVVSLHESGGGNLANTSAMSDPWATQLFVEGGQIYGQQAELSAAGIPQITVSHGNATAGGAYQVALSDYIVLVRGKTQLFLAGPPLLKAGTGEDASAEELGGAEMHATVSGTGEYLAENDADAIRIAREITAQLPADPPLAHRGQAIEPPRYDPDELIGIFPEDRRTPVRIQEIIARIVDGSRFDELNPALDPGTVCGVAKIGGKQVGIISNNGPITPTGANKASQFIELCDQKLTPLVFLQNTTGFLVGTAVEREGQVKHSAKLIQHVANAKGPKLTILVGNSYGAGNYAMASRALKPEFVMSWPSARQALMGGAQGGKVMEIVTLKKWARKGIEPDDKMKQGLAGQSQMIEMGLETISESMFCSARLMDDGIIDPRDTRRLLSYLLDVALEARLRQVQPLSYGVQRL